MAAMDADSLGADGILAMLSDRPDIMDRLADVAALDLPDCWIGAGFVRSPVWDRLHGYTTPTAVPDIDVIYFDPDDPDPRAETVLEGRLRAMSPGLPWSVRNQARMHLRNGDDPYKGSCDAVGKWVETATAVAARVGANGAPELLAPHGVADLLGLVVRPTPHYRRRMAVFEQRVAAKNWTAVWPRLRIRHG